MDDRLRIAAMTWNVASLQALIDEKIDLQARDSVGWTALHFAIYSTDTNGMPDERLVQWIALWKAAGMSLDAVSVQGFCPLHLSVVRGKAAWLGALIDAGADINVPVPPVFACDLHRFALFQNVPECAAIITSILAKQAIASVASLDASMPSRNGTIP